MIGRACGQNADWSCRAWHLGTGEPNRTGGDAYLLEDDADPDVWLIVRRWYDADGEGDGTGNDRFEELYRGDEHNAVAYAIAYAHSSAAGDRCADPDGDGCCDVCGASLETCPGCGGTGYHRAGCVEGAE